jgi:uncharacterized protein
MRAAFGAFALLLLGVVAVAAELRFPALTGRVVDQAGILSAATKARIEQALAEHERQTTDQIVVATVTSLQDATIEDYGVELGRHWGIGQKEKNNGAILLVALKERKVRIEVGYGLEDRLTDAQCRIIIERVILPAFRANNFNGGVEDGVTAMLRVLGGDVAVAESPGPAAPPSSEIGDNQILGFLFLTLWCVVFFGGWGLVLFRFWQHRRDPRWRRDHGFVFTGSSGGGGFGGSSDGFSGGGGSFGGGGASGSW